MKKIFTFIAAVAFTASVFAQAQNKMSYQTVVRNASGGLLQNTAVGLKISILRGSATGTVSYSETMTPNPTTDANGLLSTEIGGGAPIGGAQLDTINWGSKKYFIKTEIDPTGGGNYTITGTSELLKVPTAAYARTSGCKGSTVFNNNGTNTYTLTHNCGIAGGIVVATNGDTNGNPMLVAITGCTIIDANSCKLQIAGLTSTITTFRVNWIVE